MDDVFCVLLDKNYGVAAGLDVVVVVVVSVEVVPLGLAAGVTVSVFCSQAASNAAPARMQMYFFIVLVLRAHTRVLPKSEQEAISAFCQMQSCKISSDRRIVLQAVGLGHRRAGQFAIARIDPARQGGLTLAGFLQTMTSQQLDITKGHVC